MIKSILKILVLAVFICVQFIETCAHDTIFVDPVNGSINGTGISQLSPVRQIPPEVFGNAGTVILYKKGITIRGKFEYFSGTSSKPVTIGSYGTGENPVFMGSFDFDIGDNWELVSGNVWKYKVKLTDHPGANVVFNDGESCGKLMWNVNSLGKQGEWCMVDTTNNRISDLEYLFMYSEKNPAEIYQSIEFVPEGSFISFLEKDSFIVVENLTVKNVGTHCFQVNGAKNISIRNCGLSFIGGAVFKHRIGINGMWVRYGNAIEVWTKGKNISVERCRIFETYDAGFVIQGSLGLEFVDSVVVRNNVFFNNAFDNFDNSWGKGISRVYFENNTCVGAGEGWAYKTEGRPRISEFLPDTIGWHIFLDSNEMNGSTIFIRNNIFYNAPQNKLVKINKLPPEGLPNVVFDYNCYFQENRKDGIIQILDKTYYEEDFELYKKESGKDKHSFVANPLFKGAETGDFRLQVNSPCIGNGYNNGLTTNADNKKGQNIGAF